MDRRSFCVWSIGAVGGLAGDTAFSRAQPFDEIGATVSAKECTAWLENRLLSADKLINLPAGTFKICRPLSLNGKSIRGSGASLTEIIYTGPSESALFTFDCSPGTSVEIRDLTLIRAVSEGGTAISIKPSKACYFDSQRRVLIDNITFRGAKVTKSPAGWRSSPAWSTCIEVGDSWGCYISRVDAIGGYDIQLPPSQSDGSVFLRTSALGGILSLRLTEVTVASFKVGVEIGSRTFFFISDCDLAFCYDGIISTHGASDGFSEGRVRDTFINAQHVGVGLHHSSWRGLSGVAINRHKAGFKQGPWTGIYLQSATKTWIDKVRLQVDDSAGQFQSDNTGIFLDRCSDIDLSQIFFGTGINCGIKEVQCQRVSKINNHYLYPEVIDGCR
ncbi:hypothetical protein M2321_000170 [Rhodoblastus acidophilus]|nr:hypothetical protein [Rhodoblastus acidophilus]